MKKLLAGLLAFIIAGSLFTGIIGVNRKSTASNTPKETPGASAETTITPEATESAESTTTPEESPAPSPSASASPAPSATPTPSATPSPSPSPTPTAAPADKKAPTIMVLYASKDISLGENYDVKSGIMYVRDDKDGDLPQAQTLSNGTYTIQTDLDKNKPGKYTVTITARDKTGNESTERFTVNVLDKDTKAPVVMVKYAYHEITAGDKYDYKSALMYVRDDKDGDLKEADKLTNGVYVWEGTVDVNKPGTYILWIKARDKSGNESSENVTVVVKGASETAHLHPDEDPVFSDVNSLLIVANKTHKLPSGYEPKDLVNANDLGAKGTIAPYLRREAAEALVKMTNDAYLEGVSLIFSSAYRSEAYQKQLYDGYVASYGVERADRISSRPGYSDHQTGLALDFIEGKGVDFMQEFENSASGKWLHDNAYKYGFIMRYPKGKDSVTGYAYEPWHFRYVGVDTATKIFSEGDTQTLEEHFGVEGGQTYK
ncbi:MAG: D-alanyl-D-alanine carboxypeptidase family protein [Solobacterium sp.]|nr:D-alanyl-D-alanine carboxypeptidase family protein [Solobacterium sp.]